MSAAACERRFSLGCVFTPMALCCRGCLNGANDTLTAVRGIVDFQVIGNLLTCLLYTSPSPRD